MEPSCKQCIRNIRKRTFGHVRPAKIRISLRVRAIWSESSMGAWCKVYSCEQCEQWIFWWDCANVQADFEVSLGASVSIAKTCLYNIDPIKPHFYVVKLGFTGVYIIFLISAQNIHCGYSLEPLRRGGSNEYTQSMFRAEIWQKIQSFYSVFFFSFWNWKFLYIRIGVFSFGNVGCWRCGSYM